MRNSAATAAPSAVEAAAVRQAIEQANAKQRNAIHRGVGTGLVANYAADAVLVFPGEPAWRGRGEIGANGVKLLHSAKFGDMKLNTASVDVAGDYAIETLGHARFGAKVTMANAPVFERARAFRPAGDSVRRHQRNRCVRSHLSRRPWALVFICLTPQYRRRRLRTPLLVGRHVHGAQLSRALAQPVRRRRTHSR